MNSPHNSEILHKVLGCVYSIITLTFRFNSSLTLILANKEVWNPGCIPILGSIQALHKESSEFCMVSPPHRQNS